MSDAHAEQTVLDSSASSTAAAAGLVQVLPMLSSNHLPDALQMAFQIGEPNFTAPLLGALQVNRSGVPVRQSIAVQPCLEHVVCSSFAVCCLLFAVYP